MVSNAQTQDLRENLRLRSDLVFSRPGAILQIGFSVRFANRNAARLVLSANDQLLRVISALSYGPGGNGTGVGEKRQEEEEGEGGWTRIVMDYTARDRLLQLSFSYQLDSAPGNTIGLDQVAIFPSAAIHPPISLLLPLPPATTLATAVRPTMK
ncbi:hypothetical protein E0Z10_g5095 [Xylaria hypoxylon]|uniref:Uncharacterized protein n=1 Tax=Xylaria hypoxylon TaxID=37992 RepID=A0A4Z0YH57_9PEZI|nr:hypothetical protein E0Z10_g5095 [Xylaria hypoxylon]